MGGALGQLGRGAHRAGTAVCVAQCTHTRTKQLQLRVAQCICVHSAGAAASVALRIHVCKAITAASGSFEDVLPFTVSDVFLFSCVLILCGRCLI